MRLAPLARTDVRLTAHRGRVSLVGGGMQLVLTCGDRPRYTLRPIASAAQDGTTERGPWTAGDLPGLLARLGGAS